ncbi:hypothetical protein BCR33DRAFT_724924 [Rhizoclosmatium globosum]|uniref:Uncharacterized protein n=1 Tax=Rhizoclosmatium globosum TaxID=329046 RepID=A0A1Y2B1L4_9FUNG|nr:hypothetical protein BCR33DRAFT_724924 [Rhizoclosmatium globosum]|eukprot:ORY28729.1 hypothetical protein BCR33DRAFT_724924 [Rhizoclosmatium globosum]
MNQMESENLFGALDAIATKLRRVAEVEAERDSLAEENIRLRGDVEALSEELARKNELIVAQIQKLHRLESANSTPEKHSIGASSSSSQLKRKRLGADDLPTPSQTTSTVSTPKLGSLNAAPSLPDISPSNLLTPHPLSLPPSPTPPTFSTPVPPATTTTTNPSLLQCTLTNCNRSTPISSPHQLSVHKWQYHKDSYQLLANGHSFLVHRDTDGLLHCPTPQCTRSFQPLPALQSHIKTCCTVAAMAMQSPIDNNSLACGLASQACSPAPSLLSRVKRARFLVMETPSVPVRSLDLELSRVGTSCLGTPAPGTPAPGPPPPVFASMVVSTPAPAPTPIPVQDGEMELSISQCSNDTELPTPQCENKNVQQQEEIELNAVVVDTVVKVVTVSEEVAEPESSKKADRKELGLNGMSESVEINDIRDKDSIVEKPTPAAELNIERQEVLHDTAIEASLDVGTDGGYSMEPENTDLAMEFVVEETQDSIQDISKMPRKETIDSSVGVSRDEHDEQETMCDATQEEMVHDDDEVEATKTPSNEEEEEEEEGEEDREMEVEDELDGVEIMTKTDTLPPRSVQDSDVTIESDIAMEAEHVSVPTESEESLSLLDSNQSHASSDEVMDQCGQPADATILTQEDTNMDDEMISQPSSPSFPIITRSSSGLKEVLVDSQEGGEDGSLESFEKATSSEVDEDLSKTESSSRISRKSPRIPLPPAQPQASHHNVSKSVDKPSPFLDTQQDSPQVADEQESPVIVSKQTQVSISKLIQSPITSTSTHQASPLLGAKPLVGATPTALKTAASRHSMLSSSPLIPVKPLPLRSVTKKGPIMIDLTLSDDEDGLSRQRRRGDVVVEDESEEEEDDRGLGGGGGGGEGESELSQESQCFVRSPVKHLARIPLPSVSVVRDGSNGGMVGEKVNVLDESGFKNGGDLDGEAESLNGEDENVLMLDEDSGTVRQDDEEAITFICYRKIMSEIMPSFPTLPKETLDAIYDGVKTCLEQAMEINFREAYIPASPDQPESLGCPSDFLQEFTHWAYRELERNFKDSALVIPDGYGGCQCVFCEKQ